jgi:hypothetical protein
VTVHELSRADEITDLVRWLELDLALPGRA